MSWFQSFLCNILTILTFFCIDCREDHQVTATNVVFKKTKHHKGSIYCSAWNPMGDLIATGSNDKTIRLLKYNQDTASAGGEMELTFHDGTVRDLIFMQDTSNRSSLLISGGAGDCKIYVTDCETGQPIRVMSGHSGMFYRILPDFSQCNCLVIDFCL